MGKKRIIVLQIAFALAFFRLAEAQQVKEVPRIGILSNGSVGPTDAYFPLLEAFREGLRDLGYVEGKNILLEYRYAEGKLDRMPALVADLVQREPAVIVVSAIPAIHAAKQATKTIPIVIISTIDPVTAGIVDSLARPGGNITGLALLTRDLSAKRLELLTEVLQKNRGWHSSGTRAAQGRRLLLMSIRPWPPQ